MSTLKQFNYLIRIVEDGGFIAASEKLFVAQSALSRQIKLLEDELGFLIFDRSEKKVKLTAAGQVLYKNLKNHLHNIGHYIEQAQSMAQGHGRTIRVAHSSSVIIDQTKIGLLNQLCQRYAVEVEINRLSSELQVESLLSGSIDIGFIRPPVLHSLEGIQTAHLYQAALCVAVHCDDPTFKDKHSIQLSELAQHHFVATPHAKRGGLSYLAANLCLSKGFYPKEAKIRSRKISQLDLVAHGLGVCIVPEEFNSILPSKVKLLAIDACGHFSEVLLIWRKEQDSTIESCVGQILQYYQNKLEV